MLRLNDIALARGVRELYRGVTLLAPVGERIGLIGANGSGKSTLFAAILGQLALEAGSIDAPPPARIAHVAQDIEATDTAALDWVLAGHAPLAAARSALAQAEAGDDADALAHALADLAELNDAAIAAQAKAILAGLGFGDADHARPVRAFSGGWRNRLALARTLLRPADLLLLDEPTNHLDLDSVVWLEAWLRRYDGTVLIISHDREFLDRAVGTVWHIADRAIRRYAGNYSAFETALVEAQRQQDAAARQQQRQVAQLQSFVDRFRAKATKARQAQSRLKALERIERIEPVRAQHEWRFEFPPPRKLPERLLDAEQLRLGYPPVVVLDEVAFAVRAGDRIGVLGVNGAGKSTLVKALAGELAPQAGTLLRGQGLAIGYFAQHQMAQLRPDETALEHLRRLAFADNPATREQELRDFLGRYRFGTELAMAPVGPMSGGEKARLALALIAWQRPNLLLLDEPTNHLDMETREALTMALSSYEGAVLLVSHDRHLLRATVDTLWLVHDGRVGNFEGDLDDYAELVLAQRRAGNERTAAGGESRKALRQREAEDRQRLAAARKPLQGRIDRLEKEMGTLGTQLRTVDAQLADPDFYHAESSEVVAAALKRRGELANRLEAVESQWLALQAELEAIT